MRVVAALSEEAQLCVCARGVAAGLRFEVADVFARANVSLAVREVAALSVPYKQKCEAVGRDAVCSSVSVWLFSACYF